MRRASRLSAPVPARYRHLRSHDDAAAWYRSSQSRKSRAKRFAACLRLRPVATGAAAAGEPLSRPRAAVSATLGGQLVEVVFAGMTPGFVGLAQMNFKVPNLSPGDYPLVISVNGEKSNAAMVTVK